MNIISKQTKTELVRERLCRYIMSHGIAEDEMLPSESELCASFKVSRVTVRNAVAGLIRDGIVYTKPKKGMFAGKIQKIHVSSGGPAVKNIGIFMPRIGYCLSVLAGLEPRTREWGYQLIFNSFADNPAELDESLELCTKHTKLAASVIVPIESEPYPETTVQLIKRLKNPVIFDAVSPDPAIPSVYTGNAAGIRKVMDYLMRAGHRRFGMVIGEPLTTTNRERRQGFLDVLKEHPECSGTVLEVREYCPADLPAAADRYFSGTEPEQKATAFVCGTDYLASDLQHFLLTAGISGITVSGYGNLPEGRLLPITVDQHPEEQGRLCAEIIFAQISGQGVEKMKNLIEPDLVIRQPERDMI